jgi:hypothetical protein
MTAEAFIQSETLDVPPAPCTPAVYSGPSTKRNAIVNYEIVAYEYDSSGEPFGKLVYKGADPAWAQRCWDNTQWGSFAGVTADAVWYTIEPSRRVPKDFVPHRPKHGDEI